MPILILSWWIAVYAYAVDQEEYGHIVGGIDHYGVPLIDMFEFLFMMSITWYGAVLLWMRSSRRI